MQKCLVNGLVALTLLAGWIGPATAGQLLLVEDVAARDVDPGWRKDALCLYHNEEMLILWRDPAGGDLPRGVAVLADEVAAEDRWVIAHPASAEGRANLSALGSVLFERSGRWLIRLDPVVPAGFSLHGIQGVLPLRPQPLTGALWNDAMEALRRRPAAPATGYEPLPTARNSDIQEIIDQIDEASYKGIIQSLENFVTRNARRSEYHDACLWAHNTFESYGLEAEIQPFWADAWWGDDFDCYNVVAEQIGVTYPEQIYIICGHLDSTAGYTFYPEPVAPGADDNASGSGGAIEAARVLSQYNFEYTIRYICFGAEEMGLCGSYAYAAAAAQAGEQILGVINFDMILFDADFDGGVYVPYNTPSYPLAQALADAAATYVPELSIQLDYNPGSSYSDHYPFWVHGYPAILGIEDDYSSNPYYHSTSDLLANYDAYWPFGTQCLKAGVAALATLAQPLFMNTAPLDPPSHAGARLVLRRMGPNPVLDVARFALVQPSAAPIELSVIDANGRILGRQRLAGARQTVQELPTHDWPAGVVWLRAASSEGSAATRLVKVR
jgi:hypothetical protein